MSDLSITPDEAPGILARLIGDFLEQPIDYSDIPVMPEKLEGTERKAFEYFVREAADGNTDIVFESISESDAERDFITRSFELDYLAGKILFAHKSYYEASKYFEKALMRFEGYGELWFLAGVASYVMGVWGRAFMQWTEAVKANENHQDARFLVNLANTMMKNTHRHLNPEAEPMLPLVSGRGIDVGCGGAKTHPDAIGVDLIAPGETGVEASQAGKTSQADVQASGDDLLMFTDNELDYVIARHNLEHYTDPVRALKEWARVLKHGGVLGLVLPDDEAFDTIRADATHKHAFTQSSLRSVVSLIPELAVVEQGVCQKDWSIYLVAQKTAPGEKPSYPYRRRLNEMIAGHVLKRAELAARIGLDDTAAAAWRKARELVPSVELDADPDKLHPFPFPNSTPFYVSRERGGARIALACGHFLSFEWLDALERMGNSVMEIPVSETGAVSWTQELALREFEPDLFLTPRFDAGVACEMALMGIPYVAWEYGRRRGSVEWRRDLLNETTFVFNSSPSEVKRYKQFGARHVHHLPPGVNTERLGGAGKKPGLENKILYYERPEWGSGYRRMLRRIRERLLDMELPAERKNDLFRWLRVFESVIERQLKVYGEWKIPALWEDAAAGASPGIQGYSSGDIIRILGEEVAERRLGFVIESMAELGAIIKKDDEGTRGSGDDVLPDYDTISENYASAAISVAADPACPWDTVSLRALEIMACGGFALAERRGAYEGLFEEGKELAFYGSPEEAGEVARYYLEHHGERRRIAERGREKTLKNHTLEKRFSKIFGVLRDAGVLRS